MDQVGTWMLYLIRNNLELKNKIMIKEFDTRYTKNAVCPYCGCIINDSWELIGDSGEINCDKCEKSFFYERYIEVTYNTMKIEEK